jgi:hypothetical protein
MAEHTYSSAVVDGKYDIDARALSGEIEAAFPGEAFTVSRSLSDITVTFERDVSDEPALDAVVAAHKTAFDPIAVLKTEAKAVIDERTRQLIIRDLYTAAAVTAHNDSGDTFKTSIDAAATRAAIAAVVDDR